MTKIKNKINDIIYAIRVRCASLGRIRYRESEKWGEPAMYIEGISPIITGDMDFFLSAYIRDCLRKYVEMGFTAFPLELFWEETIPGIKDYTIPYDRIKEHGDEYYRNEWKRIVLEVADRFDRLAHWDIAETDYDKLLNDAFDGLKVIYGGLWE